METKDFLTLTELKAKLSAPPKIEPTKFDANEEDDDDFLSDDEYEAYKLHWFADNEYSLSEIVSRIVDYAINENRLEDLLSDPAVLVYEWEYLLQIDNDNAPLTYDEWSELGGKV